MARSQVTMLSSIHFFHGVPVGMAEMSEERWTSNLFSEISERKSCTRSASLWSAWEWLRKIFGMEALLIFCAAYPRARDLDIGANAFSIMLADVKTRAF